MTTPRQYLQETRSFDVVVVGGGMAGIAASVTAARRGASVALIQDRPVLGGNGSSEIRVNLEGANGGEHARFFVESGIAEDLLLENLWHNPTGSADRWSALLFDLVLSQPGLELFLDTHVHAVRTALDGAVESVSAVTLASERSWVIEGEQFVDATGDGTIAYLAGAAFMRGEEARSEFDEPLAPAEAHDYKLGGTMWFMCKDTGRPVHFTRPAFARKVDEGELRIHRSFNVWEQDPVLGGFWWIEYGGDLDTISDNEEIKRVLLSELYGVWDFIKNSPGTRDKNRNLDLEWVAAIPGKRESRRIVGDYILREQDLWEESRFPDAVAFGGWSIDRHPPRGFFDFDEPPSVHVFIPGIYQIPFRSLYSRDVPNLFLAGRDISASHVACCSARVQLTCISIGEAVGVAAARCATENTGPRELAESPDEVALLQRQLQREGHYIPHVPITADRPPAETTATASTATALEQIAVSRTLPLDTPRMISLPLVTGALESVAVWIKADVDTQLDWRLFAHDKRDFWIPGDELCRGQLEVAATGEGGWVEIPTDAPPSHSPGYVHFALSTEDADVEIGVSDERPYGPLSWHSKHGLDARPVDRRAELGWKNAHMSYVASYWARADHYWGGPPGPAIAFSVKPEQRHATAEQVLEPWERPTVAGVHGWVSARAHGTHKGPKFLLDEPESLELSWPEPIATQWVEIYFNSDLDRHLANMWYSYPPEFRAMTPIIADLDIEILDTEGKWSRLCEMRDNYRRRYRAEVNRDIRGLRVVCRATNGERFASITDVRIGRRPTAAGTAKTHT